MALTLLFIILIQLCDAQNVTQNVTVAELPPAYPIATSYLFIFAILLFGVVIRALMLWTSMCLPYRVVMFAIGASLGYLAHRYPEFKPIVSICFIDVDYILLTFLPIILFNISYSVDAHSFWKSFPQIFLVSVPGVLLTSTMAAFMAFFVIEVNWSFGTAMLFGVICSPIYPMEVVKLLKEASRCKFISVLLLGEGVIGDATVMILYTVIFGYLAQTVSSPAQISLMLLRFAGGGILLGIVMGNVVGTLVSLTYYDLLCAVTVTCAGAYLTYYLGEKFLYVSGLLGTVIAGVLISNRKSTIAGDVEQIVTNFWIIMSHAANTLIFTMIGVVIFEAMAASLTLREISLVFVTYTTVYVSRMLAYAIMTPVLRCLGFGMTWQQSLACVWGGLRGPLSLCLALLIRETPEVSEVGDVMIIQTTGLVILSLIINATTMQKVLKVLGLSQISLAKKANMTNCVKRIMMTRDRCISMLKMDKFLADANWDLVQESTTIKHPYQTQIVSGREEESDDDTYMGYRYTTCPDCEREIPNEPTKKEFAEMMREANQRVLKSLKISFWRQYEYGKISKDSVRILVQAVEVAADSDDGWINLDQLGTLWKPKAHAVWLRRRLVHMITPEVANARIPRAPWRQRCYRFVTNIRFDIFIYVMILCNTPVILSEVALTEPRAEVANTIKGLNVFFFAVYFFEMVIKMCAFGVRGYFSSHWNKLDFFIVVMATGDFILDMLDTCIKDFNKYTSKSSILTATKLLRMLRFLRLCKLARVTVPKIMGYMDRMIDKQLAFGYDVGKGFVTAEQEVCNLLPQLVDNRTIQEALTARLEEDRLKVTRQLGLLQRDRPWTAITVKTRQATTSTLNNMLIDAALLKEEGFLDEVEYRLLVMAIQEKVQYVRHKASLVAPSSPETQLRAISWLQGNERVADYFIENSEIINYNINEILISRGDEPKGLYILVSGLLEASYIPPDDDIDEAIPNYEFLTDLKFGEPSKDYIVSGNAVGVLGVLTNRPYSYTVRCDSAVQAYYITLSVVKEAFNLAPHPIMGLEAAMWREIGIKLSMMVLPTVPAYHNWSVEKISMRLEHAFVPCLKVIKVSILLTILHFTYSSLEAAMWREIGIKLSMMVLPTVPAYHNWSVEKISMRLEHAFVPCLKVIKISNASSRCLYHKSVRKLSNNDSRQKIGARRKRKRGGGVRRVNIRESVWSRPYASTHNTSEKELKEISSKYFRPGVDSGPSDKRELSRVKMYDPLEKAREREDSEVELEVKSTDI
ncbi:sodium/hydrogen exchanger 10-like [Cydia fagiglandana]|uniref:sodium/hydrogen exchanger 10-like n=1 Tax=Cydia fagiglandana TaxID=1458189 RepID=UPI002FEE0F8E